MVVVAQPGVKIEREPFSGVTDEGSLRYFTTCLQTLPIYHFSSGRGQKEGIIPLSGDLGEFVERRIHVSDFFSQEGAILDQVEAISTPVLYSPKGTNTSLDRIEAQFAGHMMDNGFSYDSPGKMVGTQAKLRSLPLQSGARAIDGNLYLLPTDLAVIAPDWQTDTVVHNVQTQTLLHKSKLPYIAIPTGVEMDPHTFKTQRILELVAGLTALAGQVQSMLDFDWSQYSGGAQNVRDTIVNRVLLNRYIPTINKLTEEMNLFMLINTVAGRMSPVQEAIQRLLNTHLVASMYTMFPLEAIHTKVRQESARPEPEPKLSGHNRLAVELLAQYYARVLMGSF